RRRQACNAVPGLPRQLLSTSVEGVRTGPLHLRHGRAAAGEAPMDSTGARWGSTLFPQAKGSVPHIAYYVHSDSVASTRADTSPLHAGDVVGVPPGTTASPLRTLRSWKFVTHHAQVLLAVANEPELPVQEIARAVEITERSAY